MDNNAILINVTTGDAVARTSFAGTALGNTFVAMAALRSSGYVAAARSRYSVSYTCVLYRPIFTCTATITTNTHGTSSATSISAGFPLVFPIVFT